MQLAPVTITSHLYTSIEGQLVCGTSLCVGVHELSASYIVIIHRNIHVIIIHRKRSPPHEGVVYLVVQPSLQSEWSDRARDRSTSGSLEAPRTAQPPWLAQATTDDSPSAGVEERGVDGNDGELVTEEEDEKELSVSVPSSPKLGHRMGRVMSRLHRLRSQSFDDVVSRANNEVIVPVSPSHDVSGSFSIPSLRVNSFDTASDSESFGGRSRSDDPSSVLEHPLRGGDRSSCELDSNAGEDTATCGQSSHKPTGQAPAVGRGFFRRMRLPASDAKQDLASSQPGSDTEEGDNSLTTSQKILAKFKNPSLMRKFRGNLKGRMSQSSSSSTAAAAAAVATTSDSERSRQIREARDQSKSVFISI